MTQGKPFWNKPVPEVFSFSRYVISDRTSDMYESWPPTRSILLFLRVQSNFFCVLGSESWLKSMSVVFQRWNGYSDSVGNIWSSCTVSFLWGWTLIYCLSCHGYTRNKMTQCFLRLVLLMSLLESLVTKNSDLPVCCCLGTEKYCWWLWSN